MFIRISKSQKTSTFDVPVKFTLRMKIFEATKKFSNNDRNVFFPEYARLHLQHKKDMNMAKDT